LPKLVVCGQAQPAKIGSAEAKPLLKTADFSSSRLKDTNEKKI
jgi:hypothetical protein